MSGRDWADEALEIIGPCYCDEISDGLGKGACITCLFTDALAAAFRAGQEQAAQVARELITELLNGVRADLVERLTFPALPVEEPRG